MHNSQNLAGFHLLLAAVYGIINKIMLVSQFWKKGVVCLFNSILTSLFTMKFTDVLDILVVAFLFYKGITMIRSTRASRIAKSIVLLLLVTWLTSLFHMYALYFILNRILELGFIALVIMFQPELRLFLEKVGSRSVKELLGGKQEARPASAAIAAVVTACEKMSKSRTGALIVFERNILLDEYFKTGSGEIT